MESRWWVRIASRTSSWVRSVQPHTDFFFGAVE
jgi:hypothetical protein